MSDLSEAHRAIFEGLDAGHVTGHLVSLSALGAVVAGVLPAIAALGAVIWYMIAIYETKTVQDWLRRRRTRREQ